MFRLACFFRLRLFRRRDLFRTGNAFLAMDVHFSYVRIGSVLYACDLRSFECLTGFGSFLVFGIFRMHIWDFDVLALDLIGRGIDCYGFLRFRSRFESLPFSCL